MEIGRVRGPAPVRVPVVREDPVPVQAPVAREDPAPVQVPVAPELVSVRADNAGGLLRAPAVREVPASVRVGQATGSVRVPAVPADVLGLRLGDRGRGRLDRDVVRGLARGCVAGHSFIAAGG